MPMRRAASDEYIEFEELPEVVGDNVVTRCPTKWVLVDLETNQVYQLRPFGQDYKWQRPFNDVTGLIVRAVTAWYRNWLLRDMERKKKAHRYGGVEEN